MLSEVGEPVGITVVRRGQLARSWHAVPMRACANIRLVRGRHATLSCVVWRHGLVGPGSAARRVGAATAVQSEREPCVALAVVTRGATRPYATLAS